MKVFLDSIGCRLNQSEIERIGRDFRLAGHELVSDPAQADLAVINTCTVTQRADADSRKKTRQIARAGVDQIILTGCWATLKEHSALELPKVTGVVKNDDKSRLVADLLGQPPELFNQEPLQREPLPGSRMRTRAFIKVQDGCNNRCSFCITTVARGSGVSLPSESVLNEVHAAQQGGSQEIVLCGVHLGSWGKDLSQGRSLRDLIQLILKETEIPRLRLSSLEPWNLEANFFSLWQDARLCRHLHFPLQSGSNATLRRMARKTSQDDFSELITAARAEIPDVAITTDIIVGFPGETEEEFEESLAFVEAIDFAGGHVFTYSEREGTPAAGFDPAIPTAVRRERSRVMRAAFARSADHYRRSFIGRILPVLWESTNDLGEAGWQLSGLTDNYLRVFANSDEDRWNQISDVKITRPLKGVLQGRIITNY
ncbi:MAG: tRNA (N(6)-L-threonylcarbamoyladenosine(37)-C(2))-methylthiotransferase MtaB [Anaerolineales bacterium]|nr:tRNA (N(6)-L-threonylcarbamoyladenosine(37)-C(2))-methylthiotransferase MtaB [Anaerolineales bacterium]